METLHCSVEIREAKDGPDACEGVLIQEGRAAQGERAESFSRRLSLVWASLTGLQNLRAKHRWAKKLARERSLYATPNGSRSGSQRPQARPSLPRSTKGDGS